MTELTGAWSRDEVEILLEDARVQPRLACHTPAGRRWLVALWFRYRDGAFACATSSDADLVGSPRHDPAVAFEVSTNEPSYRGVRGRGTASIAPDADEAVLRALLERSLGGTNSTLASRLLADDRDEVVLTLAPLSSWDFTARMAAVAAEGA